MKRYTAFENCLPVLAGILGNALGVTVVMHGDRAYTDGKRIIIPALPWSDETTKHLVRAFIHHESMHLRFTDFSRSTGFAALPVGGLVKSLANVIEDTRGEGLHIQEWPGARWILNKAEEIELEKALAAKKLGGDNALLLMEPAQDESAGDLLLRYVFQLSGVIGLDRPARKVNLGTTETAFTAAAGVDKRLAVEALVEKIPALPDTKDSVDLAKEIIALFAPPESDQPQQWQGGNQDGNQDAPQQGDGQGDPRQGEDGDENQPEQGQGSGPGQARPQQGGAQGQGRQGDAPQISPDQKTALESAGDRLGSTLNEAAGEHVGPPFEASNLGELVEPKPKTPGGSQNRSRRHGPVLDITRADRVASGLRSRMQGLLMSERQRRIGAQSQGRKLKTNRLHRALTPNAPIFRASREIKGTDTMVWVLIDKSGSMSGSINDAMECAWAVASSLEGIDGVVTAVSLFPGYSECATPVKYPAQSLRHSLPEWLVHTDGGTPLGQAMFEIGLNMARFHQNRRILITVSDGCPDADNEVIEMAKMFQASGIETAAIMLDTQASLKALGYQQDTHINSVDELGGALTRMLTKLLLARK